jgi:hypothetical protein
MALDLWSIRAKKFIYGSARRAGRGHMGDSAFAENPRIAAHAFGHPQQPVESMTRELFKPTNYQKIKHAKRDLIVDVWPL